MKLPHHPPPSLARLLVLVAALTGGWAAAFPPAPTFTVHGIARDQFGWALKATDRATVVMKINGQVIASGAVDETSRAGENFRLSVPMDTRPTDPYRTGAQTTGNLFSIEVRFPETTLPVATLTSDAKNVGKPGEMLFIDFTVGADSDGDGIPDSWEWWQLGEMGVGPGDPRWSLATFGSGDFDNDGTSDVIEYLAGTFAFLNSEKLDLKITGRAPDGAALLAAFTVVGKTYRVESSEDLQTWTRVPVRIDGAADEVLHFTAEDTREVTLRSAAGIGRPRMIYRMALVR